MTHAFPPLVYRISKFQANLRIIILTLRRILFLAERFFFFFFAICFAVAYIFHPNYHVLKKKSKFILYINIDIVY